MRSIRLFILSYLLAFSAQAFAQVVTNYTSFNSGLASNNVTEVVAAEDGSIWVGTEDAGICRFKDSVWVCYDTLNSGLGANGCAGVIERNGVIWTYHNGQQLGAPNDKGISRFDAANNTWESTATGQLGMPHDYVYGMAFRPDGRVWIAVSNQIHNLTVSTPAFDPAYSYWNVIDLSEINGIASGADSKLWIATESNGLISFNGSQWRNYTPQTVNIFRDQISAITADENGIVWFASGTAGLISINANTEFTFSNFSFFNNLPSREIRAIDVVDYGNYYVEWLATAKGVGVDFQPISNDLPALNLLLNSSDLVSISSNEEGVVWVGHGLGVSRLSMNTVVVGTDNPEQSEILGLYPNPTNGLTRLHWTGVLKDLEMQLFDVSGQEVTGQTFITVESSSASIDLSSLPSGVYILQLKHAKGAATHRILYR